MEIHFDDFDNNNNNNELFSKKVIITVEKRNGRKCTTTVSDIAEDLDVKKIISYLKRKYNCNGSITKHEKFGEVMVLSGDQKENIYNFFVDEEIYKKEDIIVKGI